MGEGVLAWGGSINMQDTFIPRHHHLKFRIKAPSKALFLRPMAHHSELRPGRQHWGGHDARLEG
jgi:hypothetical protein